GILKLMAPDLSMLKLSASRIRPKCRDSGLTGIEEKPGLVIIWNEEILRQSATRLRSNRVALSFLLDAIQTENDANTDSASIDTGSTRSTRLLELDPSIDP